MKWIQLLILICISLVQALGPEIDPVSCHQPYPGVERTDVQKMLSEAFDVAENAARLVDTPDHFWDWRIFTQFQIWLGRGQSSANARVAKGLPACNLRDYIEADMLARLLEQCRRFKDYPDKYSDFLR